MDALLDSSAQDAYYTSVASYYDDDATTFEARSTRNVVLQRLRDQFRAASEPHFRGNVLEIGCGPGLDLFYWAQRKPDASIWGIDISPGMLECARRNIASAALSNVTTAQGSIEDVPELFPQLRFDFAYCYFGALNTTKDLARAAQSLRQVLRPDGSAVLTFVNKWYLAEIAYGFLRLRWRCALARLKPVWGGYATSRSLASRCYSAREVRRIFGPHFEILDRRGYSILYPAWYRNHRWVTKYARASEMLWKADALLNRTPAWSWGEYALYILRARDPQRVTA